MNLNDIKNKKFDRATVGGYKADDVNAFIISVGDEFEKLLNEKADLESKLVILADKLEEYRRDEESMRSALLGAQKLGDNVIKESTERANEVLEKARLEAISIVESAKSESDRINGEAKIQLESEVYALNKMKREVSRFRKQILALYQQHISLIENIPDETVNMIEDISSRTETAPPPLAPPVTTSFYNKVELETKHINTENSKPVDLKDGFNIKD